MDTAASAIAQGETLPRNAVELRGLDKVYKASGKTGAKHALVDVDLDIPRGELFGLLGPNGAGKSTLINILAGLVIKSGGEARIWGHDLDREMRAARRSIGIVPQELNIDPFFTPRELLEVQAGLYGVAPRDRRTDALLETVGLGDKAQAYARTLSGGMRRRLMVAKAMVHDPPVLVLDEPTAGVDIELRQQLWDNVRQLNDRGTTVLLTTHYLEEAEELCDRIAIINHGRVIACDTTKALLNRLDHKQMCIWVAETLTELPEALSGLEVTLEPKTPDGPEGSCLLVHYRKAECRIGDFLTQVQAAGLTIRDLSTEEADLEDIFLELTRSDTRSAASGEAA